MGWSRETLAELGVVIDAIEAATDRIELLHAIKPFLSNRGVEYVGIGQLINPTAVSTPIADFGIADFPHEYLASWFARNDIMQDPITKYAMGTRNAFTWEEAYQRASKAGKRVLDRGREHDLITGLAVPIWIPGMPTGLMTLSHPNPDFSRDQLATLEILAVHTYTRLLDFVDIQPTPPSYELTEREIEILHYVAAGKTNWEISQILGTGEDNIKKLLGRATKRLNAVNRAHAVMLAIKNGDIMP